MMELSNDTRGNDFLPKINIKNFFIVFFTGENTHQNSTYDCILLQDENSHRISTFDCILSRALHQYRSGQTSKRRYVRGPQAAIRNVIYGNDVYLTVAAFAASLRRL